MKQTAVEQLEEYLAISLGPDRMRMLANEFDKAKEMEKQQAHEYAEFAIICDRKDMKILEFDGYIKLETFKSE